MSGSGGSDSGEASSGGNEGEPLDEGEAAGGTTMGLGGACATPDADRDGFDRIECGGPDCDDGDPLRYPGNPEVCDSDGRDEDCDPNTLGHDRDNDGHIDALCCNSVDGKTSCGTDCDDSRATIFPGAVESCNYADDNCDGSIDEGVTQQYYRDEDGDAYGTTVTINDCAPPPGYALLTGDCDDTKRTSFPGSTEICEGSEDEDCDGAVDNGCTCTTGLVRECGESDGEGGFSDEGICQVGVQECVNGVWDSCVGDTEARVEICDGLDDDCDGEVDDDYACAQGSVESCQSTCDGHPPLEGTQTCKADCSGFARCVAPVEGPGEPDSCNGCDDDGDGSIDEGFECQLGLLSGCTTACGTPGTRLCQDGCTFTSCDSYFETCNFCDDDGDGEYRLAESATAPATNRQNPLCASGAFQFIGATSCSGDGVLGGEGLALASAAESTTDIFGAFSAIPMQMGYGETRVSVNLGSIHAPGGEEPDGGWAIVLREAGGAYVPTAGDNTWYGIPNDKPGYALFWGFQSNNERDHVRVLKLTPGEAPTQIGGCGNTCYRLIPESVSLDADSPTFSAHQMTLVYTPRLDSSHRETIAIEGDIAGGSWVTQITDDDVLPPGTMVEWGLVAFTKGSPVALGLDLDEPGHSEANLYEGTKACSASTP